MLSVLITSYINRSDPGFQHVNEPVSSKPVLVTKANDKEADIKISQPSDCLLLQRDDVKCHKMNELTIRFRSKHTDEVGVADKEQSTGIWKQALHHLLNTYRPTWCYVHTEHHQTGITNGHEVKMMDGTSYGAYWNESQSLLSIRE